VPYLPEQGKNQKGFYQLVPDLQPFAQLNPPFAHSLLFTGIFDYFFVFIRPEMQIENYGAGNCTVFYCTGLCPGGIAADAGNHAS
jgi:hypothetical protein